MLILLLAGCSGRGAHGLPVPPPTDFAQFSRSAAPHTALAAPVGFMPAPDLVTPLYQVPAARLYGAIRAVAAGRARTFLQIAYDDRLQAHFVVRSALQNFPDLVSVQVLPQGAASSTLIVFSTSVYGSYDFGVNRRRVRRWLEALNAALAQTSGS